MEFALTHPDTGIKQITVIFDGVPYEADSNHPWWDEIVRLCLADDERVLDLFPIRPVQKASQEIPLEEAEALASPWIPYDIQDVADAARRDARPDEQARVEVEANLNRPPAITSPWAIIARQAERERDAAYETVRLRGEEIMLLITERDDYASRLMDLAERTDLFESAIKTYASHVWNDIKRMLEGGR